VGLLLWVDGSLIDCYFLSLKCVRFHFFSVIFYKMGFICLGRGGTKNEGCVGGTDSDWDRRNVYSILVWWLPFRSHVGDQKGDKI
jgi:hypothetical protein